MMLNKDLLPAPSQNDGVMVVQPDHEIWARAGDGVHKLAEKILDAINAQSPGKGRYIDIACIGAGAVNQANKAVADARKEYQGTSWDLAIVVYFSVIEDDRGQQRTRLMLRVVEVLGIS